MIKDCDLPSLRVFRGGHVRYAIFVITRTYTAAGHPRIPLFPLADFFEHVCCRSYSQTDIRCRPPTSLSYYMACMETCITYTPSNPSYSHSPTPKHPPFLTTTQVAQRNITYIQAMRDQRKAWRPLCTFPSL